MATSTLLQCLNEGSDFGVTASNRRQVEVYIAAETVAEKDAVSLDLSQSVDGDKALKIVKADTGTQEDRAFVGVVLKSAEPDGSLDAGARIFVAFGCCGGCFSVSCASQFCACRQRAGGVNGTLPHSLPR